MTHTLLLPDFTPTPLNRVMRGKRRQRIALAKGDRELVAYEWRRQGLPDATTPRRVSLMVTVANGQRRADPDGLWKGLLDALVACGALVNDSARWCELGSISWDRAKHRQTVVTLEDLELTRA